MHTERVRYGVVSTAPFVGYDVGGIQELGEVDAAQCATGAIPFKYSEFKSLLADSDRGLTPNSGFAIGGSVAKFESGELVG